MEQLAYCETRCECLRNPSAKIEIQAGIPISDKMRFCKGDGPAVELECGQQRGGHFYCAVCAIHANRIYELDHAFRCQSRTLEERRQSILRGPISRRYSLALHPSPSGSLSKAQLQQELRGRNLRVADDTTKSAIQKALILTCEGKREYLPYYIAVLSHP